MSIEIWCIVIGINRNQIYLFYGILWEKIVSISNLFWYLSVWIWFHIYISERGFCPAEFDHGTTQSFNNLTSTICQQMTQIDWFTENVRDYHLIQCLFLWINLLHKYINKINKCIGSDAREFRGGNSENVLGVNEKLKCI